MQKISKQLKLQIIGLRKKGFSIPEISKSTSISKTTVYRYSKDVKILPEFLANWAGKRGGSHKIKLQKESQAIQQATQEIKTLSRSHKILIIATLYWAEGNKKDFSFTNTDPILIKIFVELLKDVYQISPDQLLVSARLYEDLNKKSCVQFWSNLVGISPQKFHSTNIIPGKKKGKLKYGMCRIRVKKGGDLLKAIFATKLRVAKMLNIKDNSKVFTPL